MTAIGNISWTNSGVKTGPTAAQKDFANMLHQKEQASANDEETKTMIERSVVTAGDGSQVVILTQVTVDASGKKLDAKVISRMKIGKNEQAGQCGIVEPPVKEEKNADETQKLSAGPAIKNTAGKEYEQHSLTGSYDAGLLFQSNI